MYTTHDPVSPLICFKNNWTFSKKFSRTSRTSRETAPAEAIFHHEGLSLDCITQWYRDGRSRIVFSFGDDAQHLVFRQSTRPCAHGSYWDDADETASPPIRCGHCLRSGRRATDTRQNDLGHRAPSRAAYASEYLRRSVIHVHCSH